MDPTASWPADFTRGNPTFDPQFNGGQSQDDWQDWLRWDPAADSTSPENDTSFSGSSKNDSPLQDPVFPVGDHTFNTLCADDTIAPPLVAGDDAFDFGVNTNDPILFGASNEASAGFDFNAMQQAAPVLGKIDTNLAPWPLPTNAQLEQSISLSALTNPQLHQLSSTGPLSAANPSLHHSPASSSNKRTSSSSHTSLDVPKKKGGRKRKAQLEPENNEENIGSQEDGDGPPVKKTSHNVIEKRYRNNLNDKIVELRNSVPALRAMSRTNHGQDDEDLEGLAPAHKLNKATVMGKATEYIKHLEKRNKTMQDKMDALKARMAAVEATFGSNRNRTASASLSPPSGTVRPRQPSPSSQASQQGFLNVPQEQARFSPAQLQQQYIQQQAQPTYARPPNPPVAAQNQPQFVNGRGGFINKAMIGTMAGLMVMEGYSEQQRSEDGSSILGAVPGVHLFKRGAVSSASSPAALARQAALPLLKMFLVIGAVLYLLAPVLSFSPRRKQKAKPVVRLLQAPSLASPVEMRRKAWLTALQTVYVPKHFLLEVIAVGAKMLRLSVRRLLGAELFTTLTGTTQEEEAARIKAWDIAVDAQLAGGDAEISYKRLLLTLMASGTTPDSPTRLMQKAVHFRVFFWEVANAGYGDLIMFKQFTAKVGKIYWDSARKLQKELVHVSAQGRPDADDEIDLLPDHLARLVELDCDDVLSDEMIQRAWNLAWNKPSAYRTEANAARDSVVEDHAIRSPLDAVAAWYANMTVDDTLVEAVGSRVSGQDTAYYLGLAESIAPPASGTLARCLAAKAVLSNTHREANIIVALDALPVSSPAGGINVIRHAPASPDLRIVLTFAKLLSLSASTAHTAARTRSFDALAQIHLFPTDLTLLSAVASYRVLQTLSAEKHLSSSASLALEDLASSLRIWVGTSAGRNAGLGRDERGRIVDMCLFVAKKAGGWNERDSGYGSLENSPVRSRAELVL